MEKQYAQKKAKAAQLSNKALENKDIKREQVKPTTNSFTDNSKAAPQPAAPSSVSPLTSSSSSQPQIPQPSSISSSLASQQQQKIEEKIEKEEEAKPAKKETAKVKKEEAIAKGLNLHASKKHCMYICRFIKDKPIDKAISELQEVIKLKRAIPFKGEIPHRHQLGVMSGRYPVKAAGQFIYLLKALKGNTIVNGLELEKTRIFYASANWASRPQKRGGARFKRTNVLLKAKEFNVQNKTEKPEMKETKQEEKK
jgi:large subunit ribosomal protein L22